MEYSWGFLLAASVTFFLLFALRPVAVSVGLLDRPGGRKQHGVAVPLIGGIAMYCGVVIALAGFKVLHAHWVAVMVGSGMLVVLGLVDDLRETPATVRLLGQLAAVGITCEFGDVHLESLGNLLGTGELLLGDWGIPFTVIGAVGVINAFNMIDGLDGLASGLATILYAILGLLAWRGGMTPDLGEILVLLAVVSTFFVINFRIPGNRVGRVFMGDAGSMFLGLSIACLLIRFSQAPHRVIQPVIALWLFAVPLVDTVCLMVRRVARGRSPFCADRGHFHHVLLRAGLSERQTVYVILGCAVLFAATGLAGMALGVPESVMFYGFLALAGVYFVAMMNAWRIEKVLGKVVRAVKGDGVRA